MREIGVKKHSWLSNPLDWVHIDRMILLAVMVLLIPLFFGSVLVLCLVFTPNWLHPRTALFLLAVYAGYAVALALFIAAAFRRRKTNERWSLFENFIIASYVIVVFVQAWLSGTHFTGGMLLMMIGVYMTSALADIRKIFRAHIAVAVLFVAVCFAEGSGRLQYAPLFAKPPIHPDGSSTPVWFAVQIAQITALLVLTRIGIMATQRWVERENLFREMSTIDGLTRLTNRRSFIERSETEFARASRVPVTGISCVMIDIDHFKKINDTLGHPAGDTVLIQVSALLLREARQYDEVARYGGEEFAILMPETSLDDSVKIAERLRERIAEHAIDVDGKKIHVTASFGVASFPAAGIHTIGDLLKVADEALYKAKYGGRNRVVATRKKIRAHKAPAKKRTRKR
ncbi:MAG: GGDEF domain-containing protein [Turneriella sp.]|nr:GGDEF domain-containing protein [Turneriella sp.]